MWLDQPEPHSSVVTVQSPAMAYKVENPSAEARGAKARDNDMTLKALILGALGKRPLK